jgi:vacuolar-type H+-ATPase subunit I/STV1
MLPTLLQERAENMMVQCIKEEFEVEWDGGRQRVQGSEDEEGGEEEEQDLD